MHGINLPASVSLVLVLNAGSSSIKVSLIADDGTCPWRDQRSWSVAPHAVPDPESGAAEGLEEVLESWLPQALAPWIDAVALVGHRIVHGGERFTAPTRLDDDVQAVLGQLVELAPLHNPPALGALDWLRRRYPELESWACFDTAFHSTLPPAAHTYAIPAAWRQAGLRRFGFHGLNHQHVAETVARRHGDPQGRQPLRLISCHLGAGCSLCAIETGRSIATTMGFTPLEGLVMASRSGSVDPGLLLHQLRRGLTPAELDHALNQESGLLGLSERSGSMEDLRSAAQDGHPGAALAIDVFRHQLLQGIGAMAASLGGVDVIALTGGIGEHDGVLAQELKERLAWLGQIDWMVIPADEEGMIARSIRRASANTGIGDTGGEGLG